MVGLQIDEVELMFDASPEIAEYTVVLVADLAPSGTVVEQLVEPGGPPFVVRLSVSAGPVFVAVPDVEGLTVRQAINILAEKGLSVFTVLLEEPSDTIPEGHVIRTEPSANTLVPMGSGLKIVTSTGEAQVVVPQLDGLFADVAILTVRNAGLDPIPIFEPVSIWSPQVGRVIQQSPVAFEEVDLRSPITIIIGEATAETTTTTVAS